MDTAERNRTRLLKQLIERGGKGRFFATVDLLERLFAEAPRVGGAGPPRLELIRFRHHPGLAFSAGDIHSLRVLHMPASGNDPARHVVEAETTFLGLTGSISPLPSYIAEQVLLEDVDNPIRRDFLDVFHHRALSLLYRGVARVSMPREHTAKKTSVWIRRGLALGGVDAYEHTPTKVLPVAALLRLLPLLVARSRGARSLQTALRHVLAPALDDAQVSIVENLEGWLELPTEDQMLLGKANHALGQRTHLGIRTPERSGKFALEIGPLRIGNYQRFLPGGDQLSVIRETVQMFTRNPVDYDLHLVVGADAVPSFALSMEHPAILGRTTWLAGKHSARTVKVENAQQNPSRETANPA